MKFSASLFAGTTVLVAWAHGASATRSNAAGILVVEQEASKSSTRNSSTIGMQSIMIQILEVFFIKENALIFKAYPHC
jgi:hypothetical protein